MRLERKMTNVEPPRLDEMIQISAIGVVTAYDPGSDSVQLNGEECWWPYSGDGISYEYLPDMDGLTALWQELNHLRRENAQLREICRASRGETPEAPE
jgi:hypothetical protein